MLDQIQHANLIFPEELIDNIYQLRSTTKTQLRSNRLGWQSQQYKNTLSTPWIDEFLSKCLQTTNITPLKHVWFNISPPKAYHDWHCHGGATWVGVFYIKTPPNCGSIEFRYKKDSLSIDPYQGLLLTFPAGLEHRVLSNNSTEDRITLAFNLGV